MENKWLTNIMKNSFCFIEISNFEMEYTRTSYFMSSKLQMQGMFLPIIDTT